MISKWLFKIKHYNVEIVVKTLSGPNPSKNFTHKKVLITPQFVVKIAEWQKNSACRVVVKAVDMIWADLDSLSQ